MAIDSLAQVGIQLGTTGVPASVALYLLYRLLKKDMDAMKQSIADMKLAHRACKKDHSDCKRAREESESGLHSRVTVIAERTSKIEGRMNGFGKVGHG